MKNEILFNKNLAHDSGIKHVSGFAEYTDDISEPLNTLYGAIGWSKKAHAKIKKIDLDNVRKSEGVISVVTYSDIPGRNDVGPVFDGDPIFPKTKVEYYGQPLFAVAATSMEFARKAVLKAKIYKFPNRQNEIGKIGGSTSGLHCHPKRQRCRDRRNDFKIKGTGGLLQADDIGSHHRQGAEKRRNHDWHQTKCR